MNTRSRITASSIAVGIIVWAIILSVGAVILWFIGSAIASAISPDPAPQLTWGDSCSGAEPPSPCLSAVSSPLEDNLGLWSIFAIGLGAGFLLAACAWLPLYRNGVREGRGRQVLARHAAR